MVPFSSLAAMWFNAAVAVIFPIVCVYYLLKKNKTGWRPLLAGFIAFCFGEALFRMQGINLLSDTAFFGWLEERIWVYALFMAVTMAIVDMPVKSVGALLFCQKKYGYRSALGLGLGFGFGYNLLGMGTTIYANLNLSYKINNGTVGELTEKLGEEYIEFVTYMYTHTTWMDFAVSGLEMLLGLFVHVAIACLVVYGLRVEKISFMLGAMIVRVVAEVPSVVLGNVSAFLVLCWYAVLAILSWSFIRIMKDVFPRTRPAALEIPKKKEKKPVDPNKYAVKKHPKSKKKHHDKK